MIIIGFNKGTIKFKVEKVIWSVYYVFFGEVSEWLKEQPWKGCVGFIPTKGSNPFLSVFFCGLSVLSLYAAVFCDAQGREIIEGG